MKHFYFLFVLFAVHSAIAQQHNINKVGIPVDGVETIPAIIEDIGTEGLIQQVSGQVTESSGLSGPIILDDVDFNGASKGQFSVSLTGAATYNIPIDIPQGINNIVPNIGLAYNSQGGNGIVGYGWNISGLSTISKIGSNKYFDGKNSDVNYSADDRFMLDGQRLILKSGSYGRDGAEYQTETFSNVKITSHGATQANNGPEYFKVQYPDGSIAYYGRTYDSVIVGLPGARTRTSTVYALTYLINPQNVVINYHYIVDNGNLLISTIRYGYRSTNPLSSILLADSYNFISFTYKNRNRAESAYVYGDSSKITKILDKITVKGFAENYRNYQLTYKVTSLGYEQLQKITETSGDGTLSKSPVSFSYGSDLSQNLLTEKPVSVLQHADLQNIKSYNIQVIPGDYTGSGKLGYLMYHTSSNDGDIYDPHKQITKGDVLRIFDPNTNLLYSKSFSPAFNEVVASKTLNSSNVLLPNQGFTTIRKSSTIAINGKHTYNFSSYIFMPDYLGQMGLTSSKNFNLRNYGTTRDNFISGDFNGDGVTDIIRTEHPKNYRNSDYNDYSTAFEIIDLKNNAVYNTSPIPIGFNYHVIDINGDGSDELVVVRDGAIYIYKFNQTFYTLIESAVISSSSIVWTNGKKTPVHIGDFNGDGKTDFVVPTNIGSYDWVFFIDKGNGQYKQFVKNIGVKYTVHAEQDIYSDGLYKYTKTQDCNIIFQDINNDGKTDVIQTYQDYRDYNGKGTSHHETLIGFFDNLQFDAESESVNFSFTQYSNLNVPNGVSPLYTVSNYGQKSNKTELAFLSNNRIGTLEYKKNNVITQQLKSINEFDIVTKITYDTYDESKTIISTNLNESDVEDGVTPFVSFNEPRSIYPKADIDVAPGMYLVKKVTYDVNKKNIFGGSESERKQLFSYADPTIDYNGKGFLGFKGRMVTSIYNGDGMSIGGLKDQIKNVTIFDLDNNSLVKEEIVAHNNNWSNFFSPVVNFISKKTNTFSITNQTNKVFKAENTQSLSQDGLTGVQRTVNTAYDNYSNPLSVTETVTAAGESSVLNTVFTYNNNLVNDNYYVGRPLSKIITTNNVQTGKETYAFSNHLLSSVTKQGATDAPEIIETNAYDAFGNVTQKTISAVGIQPRVTKFTYDNSGRYVEKSENIEGQQTSYLYNKNKGWLLSQTDPYGLTVSTAYNSFGVVTSETDYLGNTITYAYKTSPSIIVGSTFVRKETNSPDGTKSSVTTNGWGNKTVEAFTDIDNNWIYTSYTYDSQNRMIKKSEPYSITASLFSTVEYDEYGRVIKSVLPTGRQITSAYNGLSTTVNDGIKTKKETKNVNGQTKKVVDNGETISYSYNSNGTLESTTYGTTVISFEYDGWGRKTKMTDPSAGIYTYQYNSIGDLLKETTPNGATAMSYDAVGKIATTSYSGKNLAYNYNTDKLVSSIITNSNDGHYVQYFTYDNYKRIITKKNTTAQGFTYTYNYTYDALGRQLTEEKTVAGPSGTDSFKTKNVYKNGYLWKLQNAANNLDLKIYNSFNTRGQLVNSTLGNGLVTNRTYDQYGYLNENAILKNNVQFFTHNNTWDIQRGNLLTRTNNLFAGGINETFQYDTFDRLTNNIAKQGTTVIAQETNVYDDKGRILNNNVGDYKYDPSKAYQLQKVENLNDLAYYQNNPLQEVTYNAKKSPMTIKQQGKENIYFIYDGFNSRVAMYYGNEAVDHTASSKIRYYSPDGDIEIDFDKATNKYVVNMYVDGDPYSSSILQRKENNTTELYYLHRDYLGSILAVTNSAADIVEKRHFDAWGNVLLVQDGLSNNLTKLTFLERGYTGHEHLQGVGLINMNARLYDAKLHRFLAPDNFIQDADNSQSFNRYGYAWNNPLKFTDKSGEIVWAAVIVGAIIGAAAGAASYAAQAIRTDTWNWGKFGLSILSGAAVGAVSGAISPLAVTSAGLLQSAASSFVAGFMPSFNVPLGDWSFSISPSFAFGSSFGVGMNFSAGYNDGNFSMSAGVGIMDYGNYSGFGKNGMEIRKSILASYDNNGLGMSLGTNFWTGTNSMKEFSQKTGLLGLRGWGINAMYENDGKPFSGYAGDGNDQYRTAALQLSYKDFSVGFNLFTGARTKDDYNEELTMAGGEKGYSSYGKYGEYYKYGFVNERGEKYRMGALYMGYKNYRIGGNSEWVRHYIQNVAIHGTSIAAQRMFEMQSGNWNSYYQYRTSNNFTTW